MHAAVLLLPDHTWFIRWHLYVFFVTHNRSYLILNLNLILKIPFRNTMHYLSEFSLQQDSKIMEQCLQSSSSKSFSGAKTFKRNFIVVCDVTLSVYPNRASLKNMPGHGGNRTYDLY